TCARAIFGGQNRVVPRRLAVDFHNRWSILARLPYPRRNAAETLQSGFQALDDFGGDLVWRRQAVGVLEARVLEPEDVEVELVALDQLVIAEATETIGLLSGVPFGEASNLD